MERLSTADESKQGGKPRFKTRGQFLNSQRTRDPQQDLYETHERALQPLYDHWLKDNVGKNECIGELFCGNMAIVNFLKKKGYKNIIAKDKYTIPGEHYDFLTDPLPDGIDLILTNFAFSIQHKVYQRIVATRKRFCIYMKLDLMKTNTSGFHIRDHCERLIIPCPNPPFLFNGKKLQISGCGWYIGQGYGKLMPGIETCIVSSRMEKVKDDSEDSDDFDDDVDDDEHEADANVSDGDDVVYDSTSEGDDVSENDA